MYKGSQTTISAYRTARDNKGWSTPFAVEDIVKGIRSEKHKDPTNRLRSLSGREQTECKQKDFAGVTWSGTFSPTRSIANLQSHSGLLCCDIDHLATERLTQVKQWLQADPLTFICYVSPRGQGLKVVVKIDIEDHNEHKLFFAQLQAYYRECYELELDESGKDVSRLCFLSYDPDAYFNPESDTFYLVELEAEKEPERVNQLVKPTYLGSTSSLQNTMQTLLEKHCVSDAHHHDLRNFICACLSLAIEIEDCRDFLHSHSECISLESSYYSNPNELDSLIDDLYNRYEDSFGEFKNDDYQPSNKASKAYADTPLIPQLVFDNLPSVLKRGCDAFATCREKDTFLTGVLSVLSGCFPNVSGQYDGTAVMSNLYSFIVAPAASGKGAMTWAKKFGMGYHKVLLENSKREKEAYEAEAVEWEQANKKSKGSSADTKPVRPPFKMLFFPANSSGAVVIQNLSHNEGKGIIFESEADTLSATLTQDWGNYSDLLRKAFHHESITYMRKGDNEFHEVDKPQLSVCLSGTPAQVQRLIPNAEDGLFSRFIFYSFSVAPKWRDVSPYSGRANLDECFTKLEKELLEVITYSANEASVKFHLLPSHWERLNQTFDAWLKEITTLVGGNAASPVKRLGVITFRIAMILTTLRRFETGDIASDMTCDDTDFESALLLAETYKQHSILMFSQMPQEKPAFTTSKFSKKAEQMKKAAELKVVGLSNRKIAEELGVTEGTIRSWHKASA